MSQTSAAMLPNTSQFGLAGMAASSAANDNEPVDQPHVTHGDATITAESTMSGGSENRLLQAVLKVLTRIGDTLDDQLGLERQERTEEREQFFERSHALAANDNGPLDKAAERGGGGMGGLVKMIAGGLGTALIAILPEILAGMGIVAAAGVAGKVIYDNAGKIKDTAVAAGEAVYDYGKSAVSAIGKSLGFVSESEESGGKNPAGVISNPSKGTDPGGKSYGRYQLSSRAGTLNDFLKKSGYGSQFAGMKVAGADFDRKWKELAKNDPKFAQAQHDFIANASYRPVAEYAKSKGFDVNNRKIQEMLWSASVQHGLAGNKKIINNTLRDLGGTTSGKTTDQIVATYYKARGDYSYAAIRRNGGNEKYAKSASYDRYNREQRKVLGITEVANAGPSTAKPKLAAATPNRAAIVSKKPIPKPATRAPASERAKTGVAGGGLSLASTSTGTAIPSPGRPQSDPTYNMYFAPQRV